MKFRSIQLFCVLILATLNTAEASRHERRQSIQRARIQDGMKDGSLTRGETARARAGQRKIKRMEKRLEKDGVVTDEERARLEKAQDRQSRNLVRMKNNDQKRNENAAQPAVPARPADPASPSKNSAPEAASEVPTDSSP